MLSLILYPEVALLFLLPDHSHMICDRVVAWCRSALKGTNFFTPMQIAEAMDCVKSVSASYLKPNDADFPFHSGWGSFLAKHVDRMPAGYTSNYFFEFRDG